jgi:sulfite reductase alpha subunit-like flavoprotein
MMKTIDVVFNTDNMSQPLGGQGHDRTALVLYGSETGNSQDVAEELGRLVERLHFVTRVSEMDLVEIVGSLLSSCSSPDP